MFVDMAGIAYRARILSGTRRTLAASRLATSRLSDGEYAART
jgi:hypothetical protein